MTSFARSSNSASTDRCFAAPSATRGRLSRPPAVRGRRTPCAERNTSNEQLKGGSGTGAAPENRGFRRCARQDSNLRPLPPQATPAENPAHDTRRLEAPHPASLQGFPARARGVASRRRRAILGRLGHDSDTRRLASSPCGVSREGDSQSCRRPGSSRCPRRGCQARRGRRRISSTTPGNSRASLCGVQNRQPRVVGR